MTDGRALCNCLELPRIGFQMRFHGIVASMSSIGIGIGIGIGIDIDIGISCMGLGLALFKCIAKEKEMLVDDRNGDWRCCLMMTKSMLIPVPVCRGRTYS